MLRIAICDDQPSDLAALDVLLREYQRRRPGLELELFLFSSSSGVLDAGQTFDIFLLDILMPGLNGIDLARELRATCPGAPILYLTSSRDFALESYRTGALSYLVKPLDRQEVFTALDQAVEHLGAEQAGAIPVCVVGGVRRILLFELLYLESRGRILRYHTLSGTVAAVRRCPTFAQQCEALKPDGRFLLIRRGCLVNMDHIAFLGKSKVDLDGGDRLSIARSRHADIRRTYLTYCHKRGV